MLSSYATLLIMSIRKQRFDVAQDIIHRTNDGSNTPKNNNIAKSVSATSNNNNNSRSTVPKYDLIVVETMAEQLHQIRATIAKITSSSSSSSSSSPSHFDDDMKSKTGKQLNSRYIAKYFFGLHQYQKCCWYSLRNPFFIVFLLFISLLFSSLLRLTIVISFRCIAITAGSLTSDINLYRFGYFIG